MYVRWLYFIAIVAVTVINVNGETRVAIANLVSQNVSGTILFTETAAGLKVTGYIHNLPAGEFGFHVHEFGDITDCYTSGPHFNPDDNTHGGRNHSVRHVGDLGNVIGNGVVFGTVDFVDNVISLRGRNSILGRTLVLHEQRDDLGLGGDEGSLTTGNAGPRVACGVIGIKSDWNSAAYTTPSVLLFLVAAVVIFNFV